MSIKHCPSCRKEIKETFAKCPYCSMSFVNQNTSNISKIHKANDSIIMNNIKESSIIKKIKKFIIITLSILGILFIIFIVSAIKSTSVSTDSKEENSEINQSSIHIPMSDAHENNRYFLLSHESINNIEKITYLRKGDISNVYGIMEINCKKNKIRSGSTENYDDLNQLSLDKWTTPQPDWTDQDIVNFICP